MALDAEFVATVATAGKVVRRLGSAAKGPFEVGYVANSACLAHGLWKSDHLQLVFPSGEPVTRLQAAQSVLGFIMRR